MERAGILLSAGLDRNTAMMIPEQYSMALKSFSNKADEYVNSHAKKIASEPPPDLVFHHTNDVGLRGILQNKTLWLTDIFDLNDPSEIRHGLVKALETLVKLANAGTPECKILASIFREFIRTGIGETGHYFCCSFSSDGNELGQWRAYAENGNGFALAFDAKALEDDFEKNGNGAKSTFPVTYDDDKLLSIQEKIIQAALEAVQLPKTGYLNEAWGREFATLIGTILSSNSIYASTFFKHSAYRNEVEYRFLSVFGIDNPPKNRMYRSRPYSLVEYIEYSWAQNALGALKEIRIGPAADGLKASKFANDCLQAFGFSNSNVKIGYSKIPYRSATTSR